jgi:DNA-binding response OmpR family regulator
MADNEKNILIVDDDASLRWMIRVLLRREGWTISEAASGDDALREVKSRRPDLIVLDIMMPGQSGFTVISEVRALPEASRVPILVVSALSTLDDIDRALELGANDYITKPFRNEVVLKKTEALLG